MEKGKAMELSTLGLKDRAQWEAKGYQLPQFDRAAVTEATRENPCWIHFGAGNIFRAFQANVMQNILNRGEMETGLIVAEGFDYEIIEKMNRPHDDYSILVTLKADGSVEKTVVGSVVESCILDSENEGEYGRLKEIFCKQSLQMVSFTITEKGYSLVNGKGELLPAVAADLQPARRNLQAISEKLHLFYTHVLKTDSFRSPWYPWTTAPITGINYMRQSIHLPKNGQKTVLQRKIL